MPSSMDATRMMGSEMDCRANRMIRKMAAMETLVTTLKSRSVILIRSLVQGAYSSMILLISVIWLLTLSLATAYSELMMASS